MYESGVSMIVNVLFVCALIRLTGSATVLVVVETRVFSAIQYTMIPQFVPLYCHKGSSHFPFVNLFSFKKRMLSDNKKAIFNVHQNAINHSICMGASQ